MDSLSKPREPEEINLTPNPYVDSVNRKRSSTGSVSSQQNPSLNNSRSSHQSMVNDLYHANKAYSSKTSLYKSQEIKPVNGCVVLGRNGTSGNQYTTRFRVNTKASQKIAQKGVLTEECCGCVTEESRETLVKCLLSIIKSEVFLLTLHLTALTLGVVKTCIHRESIDEDIELIHTILETLVVVFVLCARVLLVRESFSGIQEYIKSNQHIDVGEDRSMVEKKLKRTVNVFSIFCLVLIIFDVAITVILHFFVHLGWTTLFNNAILVVVTAVSNVIATKISKVKQAIVQDQHKIVLYEASLLLKEGSGAGTPEQKDAHMQKVNKFIKSMLDTDLFHQPVHIELMDKYVPKWNTVTTMELMSAI